MQMQRERERCRDRGPAIVRQRKRGMVIDSE